MNPSEAFNAGIPAYGTWVLYAFIVTAAFTFGLSALAASRPGIAGTRLLQAARLSALGTCALIALDVLLLAYAFVSHDFRIRYVMRYSDRSMPGEYLFAALWGGQDGSLLWWTFLLAMYTGVCVLWLRQKHRELAPYVIATLMSVVMFFGVLMAFAANPFSANVAGAPPDGEGLNPSLQNFYMAIHPPSLYTGFVGCAVPFAFAMAALLSGRLDEEWLKATRRWALFSWLFLTIGNTLGMLWAYEELGWGGFWAWDPVENAACLPWFTMTAFLHSSMIQERRGTLKIWNLWLVILSFLLTIFGTFLTRSGLIASIHSFAQSEIGVYFLYFLALAAGLAVALTGYRMKKLQSTMEVDSVLSREAMFVANNWLLLGMCTFICVATVWPKLSEWLFNERVTVGANFYNGWLAVPGMVLLALLGIGTLTPWRKGSASLVWRSFRGPVLFGLGSAVLAAIVGPKLGYAMYVPGEPIYLSAVGHTLAKVNGALPPVAIALLAFNLGAVVQEFWRGTKARAKAKDESGPTALVRLVSRNRRRYGGYIVHVGILAMFVGFIGSYWKQEAEASLTPGERFRVGNYELRYDRTEMRRDPNKRAVYVHLTAFRNGQHFARVSPAKFIYTTHPDMPTSEVSITPGLTEDLYVVMASVNATTRIAHLRAFVNPFVSWIWVGCLIMMAGLAVAMWPEVSTEPAPGALRVPPTGGGGGGKRSPAEGDGPEGERDVLADPVVSRRARVVSRALVAGAVLLCMLLRFDTAHAQGHSGGSPPPVGGATEQMSPSERRLFGGLLCMCGDCQRLPLETCTCDFAAATRARMREQLSAGAPAEQIIRNYVTRFGAASLAVPPDEGHNRAVYALPIAVVAVAGALSIALVLRWRARGVTSEGVHAGAAAGGAAVGNAPGATDEREARRAEYDRRLDEELRGIDD